MKNQIIIDIEQSMLSYLDNAQMEQLHFVLSHALWNVDISVNEDNTAKNDIASNEDFLELFTSAKKVEGCSEKTLRYYKATIRKLFELLDKHISHITTDDLRKYLSEYQKINNCSKANIDNIRRILSSFFAWLEDENYILKSPVRRIHKIKTTKTVKETYTDEALETMRDNCSCLRDLAIIDLLASTGIRVGELVHLNITDIDFENRECIVFGKGSKERPVYFDPELKSI